VEPVAAATDKWDITAGSRLEHEKQDRDLTVYTNCNLPPVIDF
jgi:hypothetical protein